MVRVTMSKKDWMGKKKLNVFGFKISHVPIIIGQL
jgi:hypothetical protein